MMKKKALYLVYIVLIGGLWLYAWNSAKQEKKTEKLIPNHKDSVVMLSSSSISNKLESTESSSEIQTSQESISSSHITQKADNRWAKNEQNIREGAELFKLNCVACHLNQGQGVVGPNLTDDYWIIAKPTPQKVLNYVAQGEIDKGMPSWEPILQKDGVQKVTAYVLSIVGTHVKGKEPQGVYTKIQW